MLKLLRYSLLLGLGALVLAAAALTLLFRGMLLDSLVEGETRSNVALTRTFANAIWPDYAEFVRGASGLAADEIVRRPEIRALDSQLRLLKSGTHVVKVKIYDDRGLTVYSTDVRQIGEDKSDNPGVRSALAGVAASDITYRERFDAWEGALSQRNIIFTYVPVRLHQGTAVEAVMEIYSDVTPLVDGMARGLWLILGGVAAAMGLVYLVGLWSLMRYHRLLQGQESERAAQEERIRHQAYHDPLTGLPNRTSFNEHLVEALRRARRADRPLAVMFLDLDQFKRVNDSLGHDTGDRLLRVVAERLRGSLREVDPLFRMGGDEFTAILEDLRGPQEAAMVAQRMIDAVREPLQLHGQDMQISASIGVAMRDGDELSAEHLVKSADTAMYRAKELGRNRFAFFTAELNERVASQLRLEAELRRALREGEFVLHYQPRVSSADGRMTGVEALLRWAHPERGLIEPAHFVPALEDTGLIVPVGEWVLETAARQVAAWNAGAAAPLRVSVNLSSRQFRSDSLVAGVARAIEASGLRPELLEVELTESLLMENNEHAVELMHRLKATGISIAIDDFGTGYSSLAYLKRFPIDRLKIDRSFVRDLATSRKDAAIIEAICALAQSLGLGLVAEGVEEAHQAEFLRARYCTEMQGYLFGRPMPASVLEELHLRSAPSGLRLVKPGEA